MAFTQPTIAQLDTSISAVTDPIIELNSAEVGANTDDLGIILNRGTTGDNAGILWDRSSTSFALVTTTADGDSTGDLTFSAFADLQVNTIVAAAGVDSIASATTAVNVAIGAAPTIDQVLTATSSTAATWQDKGENLTLKAETASYTLILADARSVVEMNVAGANNLTVPLNSSVAFPIGTTVDIVQYGAGLTTLVATGGVTIRTFNTLAMTGQYGAVTLYKRATDEWVAIGDLT